MKFVFTTLSLCVVFQFGLLAQCSEIQLNTLQFLQKTEPTSKEAEILKLGFDLSSEQGTGGNNVRKYTKCWNTNAGGKSVYNQVVLWHTNVGSITFLILDNAGYDNLKKSVEERHPGSSGQQTVYGKMFRYTFTSQNMDGREYRGITVTLRNQ